MRRITWMVAAIVVWLASTESGGAAEQIAFIRDGDVWLMNPDGWGGMQLSRSGKCSHPYWSPDGGYLVFESDRNIWRMTLRDRSRKKLTTTEDCGQPAWRPGTNEVWYLRIPVPEGNSPGGPSCMWAVDAVTGVARRCFSAAEAWGPEGRNSWRADGKALVFHIEAPEGIVSEIHYVGGTTAEVHGSDSAQPEGERPSQTFDAAWCPADANVVALTDSNYMLGTAGLFLFDVEPGRWRRLLGTHSVSMDEAQLQWPPWSSATDASAARVSIDYSGTYISWPTWAPDGKHLAFGVSVQFYVPTFLGTTLETVWTVDADGRNAKMIAGDAEQPSWSPALP